MSLSRMRISAVAILIALTPFAATALASPVLSFNEVTGGGALHLDRTLGWRFNVLEAITVDGLGWFDQNGDGLTLGHRIGIWSPGGVLLADATVPSGSAAPLDGQFRTSFISPLSLPPGNGYIVGGADFISDSERLACGTTTQGPCNGLLAGGQAAQLSQTTDVRIQWTGAMFSNPTTNFVRPDQVGTSTQGYYGPSFSIAVPEPSCGLLGLLMLTILQINPARCRSPLRRRTVR